MIRHAFLVVCLCVMATGCEDAASREARDVVVEAQRKSWRQAEEALHDRLAQTIEDCRSKGGAPVTKAYSRWKELTHVRELVRCDFPCRQVVNTDAKTEQLAQ